jgi:hypothetical protein
MKKKLNYYQVIYIYEIFQKLCHDEVTVKEINDAYFLICPDPATQVQRTSKIIKWVNEEYMVLYSKALEEEVQRTKKMADESEIKLNNTLKGIK